MGEMPLGALGRWTSEVACTGFLRPVEIHREFMTAAARWMFAAKL